MSEISNDALRGALDKFFQGVAADPDMKGALKAYNCTIQFRVTDKVADQPVKWYGGDSGDWFYINIIDGQPEVGIGDLRKQRNWRHCCVVEIDRDAIWNILTGSKRPLDFYNATRIHIMNVNQGGGASGRWVMTLLRMGQFAGRYSEYLPCGYKKAFTELEEPIYGGPITPQ